jgi:predicted nuclease with TOPRIM domain
MGNTNNRPTTFVVVALGSMWVGPELIDEGEVLEVDRSVRNDWIGSKLARDATDQELEDYRREQGSVEDDSELQADRALLIEEIKALTAERTSLDEMRAALLGELETLGPQRDALKVEIAALEKAKATAVKK